MDIIFGASILLLAAFQVARIKKDRGYETLFRYLVSENEKANKEIKGLEASLKECRETKYSGPDFEKARKAAEAIDRFNDGVASILGYTGEGDKK